MRFLENYITVKILPLQDTSVPIEDFPDTQVHKTWAVFKDTLEGILKKELGDKTFLFIQKEVASELGYDEMNRVNKNIEGAARFIELIYEKRYRIPTLEEIIEKITRLRNNGK